MFKIDVSGLKESKNLLKTIEKLGNVFRGVQLNAKDRKDNSDKDNAQILQHLADHGRDFVSADMDLLNEIDKAVSDEIEKGLQYHASNLHTDQSSRLARKIGASAWKKGGITWNEEITRRIEEADWIGSGSAELSEPYGTQKEKKHGFKYPIGKATGQVFDNVSPESRNIKIKTR